NSVQYELAIRDEALLRSQLTLETKSLEMRRKAGLEINRRDVVLHPVEPFEIANDRWDLDELIRRAHAANRQLAAVGLQKRSADVDVDVSGNGILPQVDLTVSGSLIGGDAGAANALSSLSQADGFSVMAGLSVQFEIGGAARSARDAAQARRHRADLEKL